MDPWVHLRVASCYSLRHGVAHPRNLAARTAELGMEMLALTDRDGLYGAVKHADACLAADVRPLFGVDLACAGTRDLALHGRLLAPRQDRVVLLANDSTGWSSLCHITSEAHSPPDGHAPRIRKGVETSRERIGEWAEGVTVLLGPESDVGRAVAAGRSDSAAALLRAWQERAEVVIELINTYRRGDCFLAERMLALAKETGVPAVLTNAVRYLDSADSQVANVLDVTRKLVPLHRRHLEDQSGNAYLKSGEEMWRVARRICGPDEDTVQELFKTTRILAERCAFDLELGVPRLPEVTHEASASAALRARCEKGLARRGLTYDRKAVDRLDHELEIIGKHGLAAYFLVIADIAALIRSRGIRCAIRGSGAGSLVNHLLDIGAVDPLAHDLVMERFLSEGRRSLPDIDLDVESARRLEAYGLIFERYGRERAACVSMMETYRARSAIRDAAAAFGMPPDDIDAVAKAFPHVRARRIGAALRELPELRQSGLAESGRSGRLRQVFRMAERLDGLPRHIAMHPCGIVLSDLTLLDRTPVESCQAELPMSQFDKDDVERLGLLKLDVIGVRMQSAMAHAVAEVARTSGVEIDLDTVPRDDEPTFELIRTSRTLGCFQIESPGQRELIAKLAPRTLDDLVIDISLFRPGPVNSDMITPYLEARHARRPAAYPHPDLEEILRESLGVVVYHEQVLRIFHVMTGCGMSEAELRRRLLAIEDRAVGEWFRAKALERGYDEATVSEVWRTLSAFGAFGFCKAHAASFALPTYQSAWLKRHHPAAFYAGVLTHEPGMYPPRLLLDDARHFGIPILPLDINSSTGPWRTEAASLPGPPGIRVGLAEVKGITEAEIARIVAGQPYRSVHDFWRRAHVSRPIAERLALVGAFDSIKGQATRRDLMSVIGALHRTGAPAGDQLSLVEPEIRAGEFPELTPAERVEAELEVLGMDVSRHMLSFYDTFLNAIGITRSTSLTDRRAGEDVLVAGVKVANQTPAVRSGQRVIFLTLDDGAGPIDATFFESVQDRCAATVFGSWLLAVRGKVRRPGGNAVSLTATDCWDLRTLHEAWRTGGTRAVHQAMRRRPAPTPTPKPARIIYPNGYALSPYSDVSPAGTLPKRLPANLWHTTQTKA